MFNIFQELGSIIAWVLALQGAGRWGGGVCKPIGITWELIGITWELISSPYPDLLNQNLYLKNPQVICTFNLRSTALCTI